MNYLKQDIDSNISLRDKSNFFLRICRNKSQVYFYLSHYSYK